MGCVSSKPDDPVLKKDGDFDYTAFTRPNHLVCLTSTTYGILNNHVSSHEIPRSSPVEPKEVVETINAWELMEGLEEESPGPVKKDSDKVGAFKNSVEVLGVSRNAKSLGGSPIGRKKLELGKENERPNQVSGPEKPNEVSSVSPLKVGKENFHDNPAKGYNVGSIRKGRISHGPLTELRIESSSRHFEFSDCSFKDCIESSSSPLFDPELLASFETSLDNFEENVWDDANSNCALKKRDPLECYEEKCPPGGKNSVVLYTTTLRGIRKTFEDCNSVRCVIESYGICFIERDVSMHLVFRNELEKLMGRIVGVPRLFIKGRYIGGAGEVLELHEKSKLGELLEGIPVDECPGKVCDGCGGVRFVPCLECSGSCKLLNEDNNVVRCPDCNENGLIQCPICC